MAKYDDVVPRNVFFPWQDHIRLHHHRNAAEREDLVESCGPIARTTTAQGEMGVANVLHKLLHHLGVMGLPRPMVRPKNEIGLQVRGTLDLIDVLQATGMGGNRSTESDDGTMGLLGERWRIPRSFQFLVHPDIRNQMFVRLLFRAIHARAKEQNIRRYMERFVVIRQQEYEDLLLPVLVGVQGLLNQSRIRGSIGNLGTNDEIGFFRGVDGRMGNVLGNRIGPWRAILCGFGVECKGHAVW